MQTACVPFRSQSPGHVATSCFVIAMHQNLQWNSQSQALQACLIALITRFMNQKRCRAPSCMLLLVSSACLTLHGCTGCGASVPCVNPKQRPHAPEGHHHPLSRLLPPVSPCQHPHAPEGHHHPLSGLLTPVSPYQHPHAPKGHHHRLIRLLTPLCIPTITRAWGH